MIKMSTKEQEKQFIRKTMMQSGLEIGPHPISARCEFVAALSKNVNF